MKSSLFRLLGALLFTLTSYQGYSQSFFFDMKIPSVSPCQWDSSVSLQKLRDWNVYQTQNDRWDGPIDSSQCINLVLSGAFGKIELADINPAKPVFVRYKVIPNGPMALGHNLLWRTEYGPLRISGNASFLVSDSTCPNQHCTNVRLGVQIPDSMGIGTATRWHQGNFTPDPFSGRIGFCFPSEKFLGQLIEELLFRIQVDAYDSSSHILVPYVYVTPHWGYSTFSRLTLSDNSGPNVSETLQGHFLMLYDAPTYPSIHHPYYVDISLTPPPSVQKTISLILNPLDYLTGQPFTMLRGDTVWGGNGLRHHFVLVNSGGTICMPFIIELMFLRGDGYRHEAGQVQFQHPSSCMAFRAGSFLEIAEGATMNYGEDAFGVLLLQEDAEIRIGKGGALTISNRLMLDATSPDGNIHIYLPPGRKLSFSPSSRIDVGSKSANPDAKLVVHMRGGELDDSQLVASSRRHIVTLEEKPFGDILASAQIRYGSAAFEPYVHLYCDEPSALALTIIDLQGREVWQKQLVLSQGPHQFALPVEELKTSIYFLRLTDGKQDQTLKLWIK